MKARIIALCTMLILSLLSVNADVSEKHKKEKITFLVSMTNEDCQKRIEDKIPYEKGVTDLRICLPEKLVIIEYRTDKTSIDKLKEAFNKLGFTATPFKDPKKLKELKEHTTKQKSDYTD